jgi:hypothetical protein
MSVAWTLPAAVLLVALPNALLAQTTVTCASNAGERHVCPANTSAGVALLKSTGASACLLGKTWGYDDAGVWVADGCSGEFQLGQIVVGDAPAPDSAPPSPAPRAARQPASPSRPGGSTA